MLLQQCLDPLPHPLIPLVDELLSKVAVYFLGGHLLAGWQCHIVEVRDLEGAEVMGKRERRFLLFCLSQLFQSKFHKEKEILKRY